MNSAADHSRHAPRFIPDNAGPATPDLVRYLRILDRYKWGLLAVVLAVGTLATTYAFSLRPIYRGTATLLIEAEKPKIVTNDELYEALSSSTRDYFLTQFEIIKSRELAQRLVGAMQLTQHPEYDPRRSAKPWYAGWVPQQLLSTVLGKPTVEKAASEKDIEDAVVARVMAGISLQPMKNTQLVKINFDAHDPVLAQRVPNTLAMIYIVSDLEAHAETRRRSMAFLTSQSEELKRKLDESERALQKFRDQQKVVVEKGVSVSGAIQELEQLTTALDDARRKLTDAEALYNQLSAAQKEQSAAALETLSFVQKDPIIMRFKEAEAEAQSTVSEAAKRYGPLHPKMIAAQSDLKAAQYNVRRQVSIVIESIVKDYELAKANVANLERALAQAQADSQAYNRQEFTLARRERDVVANRQLYDLFMQRSKETDSGDVQSPIARVIDAAILPTTPFGPNKRNIVGVAMLIASAVSVSIALLLERMDVTLKSSNEVESKLEVKAVGVLPRMRPHSGRPIERLYMDESQSPFAEAIRSIRSDVLLSGIDSPQKVVLLTSSLPEEGKTTVACNLAFAFSQVKRTLIVEADMRRPKLARVLGAERQRAGLSELVAGNASLDQCVYGAQNSTLWVLQSGRVPLNPLELLSSQRFAEVMETLMKSFEVILIDSPPLQLVSDALVLSRFATSAIYVVKADSTPYPLVQYGLAHMKRVHAPAILGLGVVLNDLDIDKANRYYEEYQAYSGRYYRSYGYATGAAESCKLGAA